ncbi:hypothetical protein N658DRAFT_490577 [Parathielavia hyrcaniae]|uniref:Uncharacterized protein n=1 Tax=Parathielavia hyrcaniae TaxID=113614 RepID=A0AAN6Q9C1_9PEZI|nr:hypothetical protein N658DRAFT_490577 [Parathielavia hyrcaniae]
MAGARVASRSTQLLATSPRSPCRSGRRWAAYCPLPTANSSALALWQQALRLPLHLLIVPSLFPQTVLHSLLSRPLLS